MKKTARLKLASSGPSQVTSWRNTLGLSKRGMNGHVATTPPPLPEGLLPLPGLPSLPQMLKFPLEPSSEVSVGELGSPATSKSGLFHSLIKDPRVLYQAYLDHPDLFEEDVASLLTRLVSSPTLLDDLSEEDLLRLDQATATYAQYRPKKEEPKSPQATRPSATAEESEGLSDPPWLRATGASLPQMTAPMEIPTVPTRWWDKSER